MAAAGKFARDWAGVKRVLSAWQSSLKAAPVHDWREVAAGVAFARRPCRCRPRGGGKGRVLFVIIRPFNDFSGCLPP